MGWQPLWQMMCLAGAESYEPVSCLLKGNPVSLRANSPDIEVLRSIFVEGEYAPLQYDHPATIIDAGAHIGMAAIYFANRYPSASIFAIEPEEENFALLEKNCAPYPGITCIRAALWSEEGERDLHPRPKGNWSYTLCPETDFSSEPTSRTPCVTIPKLMDRYELKKIDILKLDVEGSEKEILDHSQDWIDRVSVIAIELHDRISPGCSDSFRRAVKDFTVSSGGSEKFIAHREGGGE